MVLGGGEKLIQVFGGDFCRKDTLQFLDVDGMLTFKGKEIPLQGLDKP